MIPELALFVIEPWQALAEVWHGVFADHGSFHSVVAGLRDAPPLQEEIRLSRRPSWVDRLSPISVLGRYRIGAVASTYAVCFAYAS